MKVPHRNINEKSGLSIRMTPLIDVIFLLMIFFVMTINVKPPEGILENKFPEQGKTIDNARQKDWEIVKIHVAEGEKGPRVYLQERIVDDFEDLHMNLSQLPRDVTIMIDPESNVSYKHVIGIYDTCLMSKKKNIIFSLPPI